MTGASELMIGFLRVLLLLAVAGRCQCLAADPHVVPLQQAHAHNDYLHDRPLLDALDNGFCSVEADIFLFNGQLLVAHTPFELSPEKTLEKLYLIPLKARVAQNGGRRIIKDPPFTLLIDIKNNGAETFRVLNKQLADYADVFTRYENGQQHNRAVTAIISGDRSFDTIQSASPRYAGIDGRLGDLDDNRVPASVMPLVSDNWRNHFRWRGKGDIPAEELTRLQQIVSSAHEQKRRLRFWATPDTEAAWAVLKAANVDLINTDNLTGLSAFLR